PFAAAARLAADAVRAPAVDEARGGEGAQPGHPVRARAEPDDAIAPERGAAEVDVLDAHEVARARTAPGQRLVAVERDPVADLDVFGIDGVEQVLARILLEIADRSFADDAQPGPRAEIDAIGRPGPASPAHVQVLGIDVRLGGDANLETGDVERDPLRRALPDRVLERCKLVEPRIVRQPQLRSVDRTSGALAGREDAHRDASGEKPPAVEKEGL